VNHSMPIQTQKPRWFYLIAVLAIGSITSAAVVQKIDDSTVTGTLNSISNGKLFLKTTEPISVPFDEITQITMKDPPISVPVAPPPTPVVVNQTEEDGPNLGNSLLGALFGSSHSQARADNPSVPLVAPPPVSATPTTGPATSQPVSVTGVFNLTNGDRIHATLNRWADQKLSMHLPNGNPLEISSNTVSLIWLGTLDMQSKAQKLTIDPGAEDIAFVLKDNDVMAVKGFVQGIIGDSLQFRYGDEDRKIKLAKIVGLQLRSNSPAPITTFHQVINTDAGDRFSGTLSAIDHDWIVLTAPAGTSMKVLQTSITTIDFLNGRVSFLTDLKPTKVEQTPYFGRLIPYRVNQSLAGGPLILSDGPCPRGIAVHSRCVLTYDISSGFDRFKTKLGFEQPDGHQGRVLARVLGDDKVLYENPDARGDQPPIDIDVQLAGVKTLVLEIDFGKDQDVGDRAVWANPRLLRGK
jgi:NPCBM/NEW2 domain